MNLQFAHYFNYWSWKKVLNKLNRIGAKKELGLMLKKMKIVCFRDSIICLNISSTETCYSECLLHYEHVNT